MDEQPKVSITYFLPDKKKSGVAHVTATGNVKKIDEYEHLVIIRDGTKIPIDDVAEINGDIFGVFK